MKIRPSQSKITCHCNKTIRKDFIPINCIKCLKSFHKKCNRSIDNKKTNIINYT